MAPPLTKSQRCRIQPGCITWRSLPHSPPLSRREYAHRNAKVDGTWFALIAMVRGPCEKAQARFFNSFWALQPGSRSEQG